MVELLKYLGWEDNDIRFYLDQYRRPQGSYLEELVNLSAGDLNE